MTVITPKKGSYYDSAPPCNVITVITKQNQPVIITYIYFNTIVVTVITIPGGALFVISGQKTVCPRLILAKEGAS